MTEYFSNAKPFKKEEILVLFESVTRVTQLLVAPFGLSEDVDLVLGEDVASNDYKAIYRNWEDSLASKLYQLHRMPEDRIAATLQLYVEKKQDPEILQILRINESLPLKIIRPEVVVELPAIASRELAIAALESVISALHAANEDLQRALTNFSSLDLQQLNSIYSSDILFIANTLSPSTLEQILYCLSSIQFSDHSHEEKDLEEEGENRADRGPVKLSYDQYVALLDSYQDDPQIQSLLLKLLSSQQQTLFSKSHLPLLKFVRYVGTENLTFCSLFCHPILSSVYAMESEINSLSEEGALERSEEEGELGLEAKEELYATTMKLLDALEKIQQHKKSNSSGSGFDMFGFPQESEDDGSGDTLQIMCVIDEIFGKEEENFRQKNQSVVYQNKDIPIRIRSSLLVERASCRNVLQELDDALRDAKLAIALEPKNASARKCRYKIYRNMANEVGEDESETDELDLNGASSDDERGPRPPRKRLLMKAAFEALAAFVLGGSSNLALAGEAEDAAREACRDEAKGYFWKRHNDGGDDDDEDENETDDEDILEEQTDIEDVQVAFRDGDISALCRCTDSNCGNDSCSTYSHLIRSSCVPKRWMISAFQALYAPIHAALDIPLPSSANQVLPHEDGLGEDRSPLDQILPSRSEDSDTYYPDQPDGDDDAFYLICQVANALSRGADGTDPSYDINALENNLQKQSLNDDEESGIVHLKESTPKSEELEGEAIPISIHRAADPNELIADLLCGQNMKCVEDLIIQSSGSFRNSITGETSLSSANLISESTGVAWNCSSPDFLEAFELLTAPLAHELTGVNFVWKEIPLQHSSSHLPHQRFRVSAGLIPAMQDAICDRSMHNSMHMVDSYESDDESENCGNQGDDADDESVVIEEKIIRKVSRQLRARLLSLCGSVAYLMGDSMGGYECMKASILLEGECLDSRIKIATMLMEMDELDKAEVHLNDAKRKWPDEVVVDLHEAELAVHRTDYSGAVDILRKVSRQYEELWEGVCIMKQTQREAMEHIGPSIFSLHGVAEFRVNPENPERALSVLKRGVQKYPRSSSLLVCLGEVLSQVGDPAGALQSFLKASQLEPGHPMPYLNASRVYQQLNQMQLAKLHMKKALQLDDSLSLTLVDIAQFKIQQNKKQSLLTNQHSAPSISSCSSSLGASNHQEDDQQISIDNLVDELSVPEILDYALSQARHVSEILDIFTAKQIATFYQDLQDKGLVSCIV